MYAAQLFCYSTVKRCRNHNRAHIINRDCAALFDANTYRVDYIF